MSLSETEDVDPDLELAGGTLTDQAYRRLEERIVTLRLEPGAVLSEAGLAQELGIGRTPVREALQRLAGEGLVTIMPRRGVLVSPINVAHQMQLLELRRELERLVARTAAARASQDERRVFADLAGALGRCGEERDAIAFMRLDRRFNRLTIEASQNPYVVHAMRQIQGLSRRFWYRHYQTVLDLPRCARLHQGVAAAIAEGAPDAAASASDALIDYVEEFARLTV